MDSPYDRVRAVYDGLKRQMREQFSPEHYVAIASGKVIADADSLDGIRQKVGALGLNEANVLLDQVGYDMLEFRVWPGWLMADAAVDYWVACLLPTTKNE